MTTHKTVSGLIVAALVLVANVAHAQKSTEVYIPIGDSPGVSETTSLQGKISSLDYASRSIEVLDRSGRRTVRVNDATVYYLSRSKYGKKNMLGSMQDCKVGRLVEVNVADDGDVEWIKVEVD